MYSLKRQIASILAALMIISILTPVSVLAGHIGGDDDGAAEETVLQNPGDYEAAGSSEEATGNDATGNTGTGGTDDTGNPAGTGTDGGEEPTDPDTPDDPDTLTDPAGATAPGAPPPDTPAPGELPAASAPAGSGYPLTLGTPDEDRGGNTQGWQFSNTGTRPVAYLKDAAYLVLEISKRPGGWMTVRIDSDTLTDENDNLKWCERFIELGDFGGDNANRPSLWDVYDYQNSALVIPLDRVYEWNLWDGGDEPSLTETYEFSEIITDATQYATLCVAYHLWDKDDPWGHYGGGETGWQDLRVTGAYLTDSYDMSFGEPGPAERSYDLTEFPDWRDIKGFRIEIDPDIHDNRCWGNMILRRDDDPDYDMDVGWNTGWFTVRGSSTYLEFSFDNPFTESWRGFEAEYATIDIRCSCKGALFGALTPFYEVPGCPADIDESHPAYGDTVFMKNLGFYHSQWGAVNYLLPDATISRVDMAQTLSRIHGGNRNEYRYLAEQVPVDGPGNVYGLPPQDEWVIEYASYVMANGLMQLKDGELQPWENGYIEGGDNSYTGYFKPWDQITRGELHYSAAALAGLGPASISDAGDKLLSSGITGSLGGNINSEATRSEVYILLAAAVRHLASEDEYEMPAPRGGAQSINITWATNGYTNEGWSAEDSVSVPAFRQYNTLVLELEDGVNPRNAYTAFIRDTPGGDHWQQRDLEWSDAYDKDTNTVTIHYGSLNFWNDFQENAAKLIVIYEGCCEVDNRWEYIGQDEWDNEIWNEVHTPSCPGALATLGIERAYLTNTEPPEPPPTHWFLDPGGWDFEYENAENQKGWNLGSYDRYYTLQTVTLTFGNNTSLRPGHIITFINNSMTWDGSDWNEYRYTVTGKDFEAKKITLSLREWPVTNHGNPDVYDGDYAFWGVRNDNGRNGYKFGISYFGPGGAGYDDLDITSIYWSPGLREGFEGADKYHLGPPGWRDAQTEEAGGPHIRGWNLGNAARSIYKLADYLVLNVDRYWREKGSGEMYLVNNYYSEDGEPDGSGGMTNHPWRQTQINGSNSSGAEVEWFEQLRIDLRQMDGYSEAKFSEHVSLIIGEDWRDLDIFEAYLEGDFENSFLQQYPEPIYYTGFTDGDTGGFAETFSAKMSVVPVTPTPEGDGWAAYAYDLEAPWAGIAVNNGSYLRLQIGETYYISAWIKHTGETTHPMGMFLDFGNISDVIAEAECAPGEWTGLKGLFTVTDYGRSLGRLYIQNISYHDEVTEEWTEPDDEFYVDSVTIWGPEPPPVPPPPLYLHNVPTSLKDIYSGMFGIGVAVAPAYLTGLREMEPEEYKDSGDVAAIASRHIAQQYTAAQTETAWGAFTRTVTLNGNNDAAAQLTGLPPGSTVLIVTGENTVPGEVSGAMKILIDNAANVDTVVFSGLFDLFEYQNGRYRFIPKDLYYAAVNAAVSYSPQGPAVVINQSYGSGPLDNTGAISHSFVELYNRSNERVDLTGHALHIQNGNAGGTSALSQWVQYNFTPGTYIEPRSSYLIRLQLAAPSARYVIPQADADWMPPDGFIMSNRAYSVALTSSQDPLPPVVTGLALADVVDMVGAFNTAPDAPWNYEGMAKGDMSKQKSVRRVDFKDSDNNAADFISLDYRTSGISSALLEEVRPRWSGDGPWGENIEIPGGLPGNVTLSFSEAAGVYDYNFDLTLEKTQDNGIGIIWYTLDGSEPVPYSKGAMRYDGPIEVKDRTYEPNYFSAIDLSGETYHVSGPSYHALPDTYVYKGTVVRAQVYDIFGNALTKPVTNTYLIDMPDGFKDLPVISISASEYDLFDPADGFFMPHNAFPDDTRQETLAYFEFFETKNSYAREVAQNLGLRLHGGWSRGMPQKSMRFYASASRDPDNPAVAYDIFDGGAKDVYGNTISTFRRFMIRNLNIYDSSFMRDNMIQEAARGLNLSTQDHRYTVVMLNGEFWGLYNMRERIDEYFVDTKYALGNTNAAVFENPTWGFSSEDRQDYPNDVMLFEQMLEWFRSNPDLSDPALYKKAQTFMDIDNYIDTLIIGMYGCNEDWPQNNIRTWRYQTADYPGMDDELRTDNYKDGRWRYILNDLDEVFNAFGNAGDTTGNIVFDLMESFYIDFREVHSPYFKCLMTNPEFAEKFINRYFDVMNTHVRPEYIDSLVDGYIDIISAAYNLHFSRWMAGDDYNRWFRAIDTIRDFNVRRRDIVISHMLDQSKPYAADFNLAGAQPVTLTLQSDAAEGHLNINGFDIIPGTPGVSAANRENWSGIYLTGLTQTITAVPGKGYLFDGFNVTVGGAPASGGYTVSENTLTIALTDDTAVEAVFALDTRAIITISEFELPMGTSGAVINATGGMRKEQSSMEFYYADGTRANLGHATRNPVSCPNNAGRWYPATGAITADNSAGWIITFSTQDFTDYITFTARQGSSNSGPRDFKLAYRTGTSGPFTEIPDSGMSILSAGDTMGTTYYNFPLPLELTDKEVVQLKVYISSTVSRSGGSLDAVNGNTSINDIAIVKMDETWIPLTVTCEIEGAGTITADKHFYMQGDTVSLTVTPGGGWKYVPGTLRYFDGSSYTDIPDPAGNVSAFVIPGAGVTVSASFEPLNPAMLSSDVIINQVYGKTADSDPGGVSRSFIELYNTTGLEINLSGMSLQVANTTTNNSATGDWAVMPLHGVIPPYGYYLIVIGSDVDEIAKYQLPDGQWDRQWSTGRLSNRGFSAALVRGAKKLPEILGDSQSDWARIYDLVGAHNASETIKNTFGTGTVRVSASQAVRRVDFANTGDNTADFETVRYADYIPGATEFDGKFPQWSGFGQQTILYGDANGDGRVNGTDVQTMILWGNSGGEIGWVDIEAAKIANDSDPVPNVFDIQELILWINAGGRPLAGYPK